MPHIFTESLNLIDTPSSKDGVDFEFIAKSYEIQEHRQTEYKISTKINNKQYLINFRDKGNSFLLKPDLITRISPVGLLKKGLNAYVDISNSNVISSNTSDLKIKKEIQDEYLKDINYFVDDFKTNKEIQIEVGFGSGRHLIHQAKKNPNVQFIGIEIHTPSIEQLLKNLHIQGIENVLVVNYDARLFMEFIDSNQVGKIFVHFPVPWDKKPHRRIYSNEFINEALRVLKIDGTLELRTDSRKYFDYCVELLTNLPKGNISIDINKDLEVSSKYEDRWKKMGKNIYDVVLTSFNEDLPRKIDKDFSFDGKIENFDLIKLFDNLPRKSMVMDRYFVHFINTFKILNEENSGLIEVTFGNFDRPVSKYILVKDGKFSYYQGNPIPTSSNNIAHKKIKEILFT